MAPSATAAGACLDELKNCIAKRRAPTMTKTTVAMTDSMKNIVLKTINSQLEIDADPRISVAPADTMVRRSSHSLEALLTMNNRNRHGDEKCCTHGRD